LHQSSRLLWVDAVSLNQLDNEEKNIHVPIMGRIFANAQRVIIWLGHARPMDAITVSEIMETIWIAGAEEQVRLNAQSLSPKTLGRVQLPRGTTEDLPWRSLKRLFNSPWLSRIWCVQELKLARHTIVLWGDQEIYWPYLSATAGWIKMNYRRTGSPPHTFQCDNVHELAKNYRGPKEALLLSILHQYRSFKATDPRDKVYGLLGLMRHHMNGDPLPITVDYSRSVASVYADALFASLAMQEKPSLRFLNYVVHPSDYDGDCDFRSWVPRWDEPWNHVTMNDFGYAPYDTTKGMSCEYNLSLDSDQLYVKGLFYDNVEYAEDLLEDGLRKSSHATVFEYWRDTCSVMKSSNLGCHSILQSMALTLAGGQIYTRRDSSQRSPEEHKKTWISDFLAFVHFVLSTDLCDDGTLIDPLSLALHEGDWITYAGLLWEVVTAEVC
jgi:hypothetical protein